jgi:hypothetical protein
MRRRITRWNAKGARYLHTLIGTRVPFSYTKDTDMAKKSAKKKNLPEVSKQTAGGIGGAVIGGMVAGPIGAIAAGVA